MNLAATAITSHSNPSYRRLLKLHTGKGIKRENVALVCGRRLVAELLAETPAKVAALVYPLPGNDLPDGADEVSVDPTLDIPADWQGSVLALSRTLFEQVDLYGTGAPLAVVSVQAPPVWSLDSPADGFTLFLPFGDPENLGAALRSAAAFGVDRVVLLAESAHPFHPRSIRASAGMALRLDLMTGPALADLVARPPTSLHALQAPGADLSDFVPPADFSLVVGEEGRGLPDLGSIPPLAIPIEAGVESLNAAVATGIALFSLRHRRGETRPDPRER